MATQTERRRRRAERIVSLAASLRGVTQDAPAAAPRPPRRKTRWRRLTIVLLTAGVIAAVPYVRGLRPVDFLIRRWQVQSSLLSDVQAARHVRLLSALGRDALPLLAEALSDERTIVAEAAAETLEQDIQTWKQLPLDEASRRAATLVHCLRANATKTSPAVVDNVREMVVEILRWPVDKDAVDSVALVADCEDVLAKLYKLPLPSLETSPIIESPAAVVAAEPNAADADSLASSPSVEDESTDVQIVPRAPITARDEQFATSAPADPQLTVQDQTVELLPAGSDHALDDDALHSLSVIHLAEQLVDRRAEVVVSAANELKRRGFEPEHITLLERLFDPSPSIRRAALDEIPRMANFDSRPWLKHLSQDPDSRVRRAAIALLATSNDPDAQRHLRQLEGSERDASILETIRKQR